MRICASAVAQSSLFEVDNLGSATQTPLNHLLFLFIIALLEIGEMQAVRLLWEKQPCRLLLVGIPAAGFPQLVTASRQPSEPRGEATGFFWDS